MTGGAATAATVDGDGGARRVRRSPLFWLSRLLDLALGVVAFGIVFDPRLYDSAALPVVTLQWTAAWLLLGLVYTVARVVRARRARLGDAAWPDRLPGRVLGYVVLVATIAMVVSCGATIATRPVVLDGLAVFDDPVVRGRLAAAVEAGARISLPTVFVAWIVLHLSYAERYARIWLRSDPGDRPIEFPGTPSPTFLEFVYFSFTVGVSVATSDTSIRSDHVRGVVLRHAILSFLFSTVIVGIVIGLVG